MVQTRQADVLDCSRPAHWLFWFLAGAGLAIAAMSAQGSPNWASLLRVGSANPALGDMERELGPIVSPDPTGHDAQLYYLIARDPFAKGTTVASLAAFDTNSPRYRYRRILFPLLAGGMGQFGGWATLLGMIVCVAVGMGLATVAAADLAFQLHLRGGAAFVGALNIGALLSAMILTADVLALGLGLAGVALAGRRRTRWAVAAFTLSVLTKEVYLLVPLSVAAWQWRQRRPGDAVLVAAIPALTLGAWSIWVWTNIPEAGRQTPHLGLPMAGILDSIPYWEQFRGRNVVQLSLAAYAVVTSTVAIAMLGAGRSSLLRWVVTPWLILACCSTLAVWKVPSNAVRAFSILWPLSVLLLADRIAEARRARRPTTGKKT